jgi:hypothetical protein
LGLHFNPELPFVTPTGISLKFDLVQDFGEGHFRYSNSNYVIDAIEVEN